MNRPVILNAGEGRPSRDTRVDVEHLRLEEVRVGSASADAFSPHGRNVSAFSGPYEWVRANSIQNPKLKPPHPPIATISFRLYSGTKSVM